MMDSTGGGKEIWSGSTDWAIEDVELETKEGFRIQILELLALAVEINLMIQPNKGTVLLDQGGPWSWF